jgi:hypothetical protein
MPALGGWNLECRELLNRLEKLTHEIKQIKASIVLNSTHEGSPSAGAWQDLLATSEEISRLWEGPSALDEIRDQRDK